jgi:hypothetical protein
MTSISSALLKDQSPERNQFDVDTTFEVHYSISDLAERWRLGRETIRLLVKDEPGVVRVRMGSCKSMTRYSVPESVARRVHTRLFNPRKLALSNSFGERDGK